MHPSGKTAWNGTQSGRQGRKIVEGQRREKPARLIATNLCV